MPSFTATNSLDLNGSQVVTGGLTIGNIAQGSEVTSGLKVTTGGVTVDSGGLTVTAGGATVSAGGLTVSAGAATVPYLSVTGLNTDVNSGTRIVGATASGAPIGGTYAIGDVVIARNGSIWICTTAGSPGTWTQVSGGGGGGASLSTANTWTALQTFGNGEITIGRTDSLYEGGQINLNRATDNAIGWYIDVYGNTAKPTLRFFNNDVSAAMGLDGTGKLGIGTFTPSERLEIAGNLRLNGTSGYTVLAPAATPSSNMTYTLPAGAPSANGYVLSSTTGGTMSWSSNSISVNGTSIALGGSATVTATATNALTIGTGLSGTSYNGSAAVTIAIDSTVALRADTTYIGTTSVALNRTSANLALTGISSVTLPGATSGSVQIVPAAVAGTGTVLTLPATTGTVITTGDSGTVTNTMLAGSIATGKLASVASTNTASTLVLRDGSGNFSAGTITAALSGNASTATKFASAVNIQGVSFDGSAAITVLTAGTGVSVSGTQVSIGQAVATTSNVTFNDLTISGNLTVSGTTTTVNSTVTTIVDPIIDIGGAVNGVAPTTDDSKDRGVTFQWHNGTAAKRGFFGFDRSTQYLSFVPDATIASEVVSGTPGDIQIANVRLYSASSGIISLVPTSTSSNFTITLPATTGTVITTGDSGTVTNTMLAGSIANAKLANSSITVNGTSIALGGSATVTANTTNAITIGSGLSGTTTTFNGSAANTISLDLTNSNTWTIGQTFSAGITNYSFLNAFGTTQIGASIGYSTSITNGTLKVGTAFDYMNISMGNFETGMQCIITSLGNTTQANWNILAGTSGITYAVNSSFTVASGQNGKYFGTGTAKIDPAYFYANNGFPNKTTIYGDFSVIQRGAYDSGSYTYDGNIQLKGKDFTLQSNHTWPTFTVESLSTASSVTPSILFKLNSPSYTWNLTSSRTSLLLSNSGSTGVGVATDGSVYIGAYEQTSFPFAGTLRAPAASGTDIAGVNLTIQSGNGTGTGGSGIIVFQTAAVGTTGTSANSMTERMRISSSGNVGIGQTSPGSALDVKGTIRLSGATSGYVGFAPAAAAGTTTYTLPSAAPTANGQVLSSTTAGVMSWVTQSGGGGSASTPWATIMMSTL